MTAITVRIARTPRDPERTNPVQSLLRRGQTESTVPTIAINQKRAGTPHATNARPGGFIITLRVTPKATRQENETLKILNHRGGCHLLYRNATSSAPLGKMLPVSRLLMRILRTKRMEGVRIAPKMAHMAASNNNKDALCSNR